jgi:hypothetical protein
MYACDPGQVAIESAGQGGYFTSCLLQHLDYPVNFPELAQAVLGDVKRLSGNKQRPRYDMGGAQRFTLAGKLPLTFAVMWHLHFIVVDPE